MRRPIVGVVQDMNSLLSFLVMLVAYLESSPIHKNNNNSIRIKRDDTTIVDTTVSTFSVERLDAPIERIEIRLIDENATNIPSENIAIPAQPLQPTTYMSDREVSLENVGRKSDEMLIRPSENTIEELGVATIGRIGGYDERYKKVEYVSDTHLAHKNSLKVLATMNSRSTDETDIIAPSHSDETANDDSKQTAEAKIWLSLSTHMPKGDLYDGDIGELPPEIDKSTNQDDEPEPVEECLENKSELVPEVVKRLQDQAQRLARLIRKLNKQQQQYCVMKDQPHLNDEYRQCPIWREEKMVHYYKLMRITYCADYNKWPNATRIKRTYAQYLPLFETLYAFQKQ